MDTKAAPSALSTTPTLPMQPALPPTLSPAQRLASNHFLLSSLLKSPVFSILAHPPQSNNADSSQGNRPQSNSYSHSHLSSSLSFLVNSAQRLELSPNEILLRQGDTSAGLYVVEHGSLHVIVQRKKSNPFHRSTFLARFPHIQNAAVKMWNNMSTAEETETVEIGEVKAGEVIGESTLYAPHALRRSSLTAAATHTASSSPAPVIVHYIPLSAIHTFLLLPSSSALLSSHLSQRRFLFNVLSRHSLFSSLDDEFSLENLLSQFERKTVKIGDDIVKYGEKGDKFFILEAGECDIFIPEHKQPIRNASQDNAQQKIDPTLTVSSSSSSSSAALSLPSAVATEEAPLKHIDTKIPGDSFGDIALLYDVPRSATVRCRACGHDLEAATHAAHSSYPPLVRKLSSYLPGSDSVAKNWQEHWHPQHYTPSSSSSPSSTSATAASTGTCVVWSVDRQTFLKHVNLGSLYLKKIFESHASQKDEWGAKQMTQKDFMKAIEDIHFRKENGNGNGNGNDRGAAPAKQPKASPSQLRLMFKLADTSGDNLISFPEFVVLHSLLTSQSTSLSHSGSSMNSPLQSGFDLTLRESSASSQTLTPPAIQAEQKEADIPFQLAFRLFDREKKGYVTKAEFIGVLRSLTHDIYSHIDLTRDPQLASLFVQSSTAMKDGEHVLSAAEFEQLLRSTELQRLMSAIQKDLMAIDEYIGTVNAIMAAEGEFSSFSTSLSSVSSWSWKTLLAGGVAGAVSRTVVAPFERLKLLFQMQLPPPKYTSIAQALRIIYREDGWKGYWRGNLANVVRITPTSAFQFFFNDLFKSALYGNRKDLHPVERLFAGGNAGIAALVLTYPLDFIRARLTYQTKGHEEYKGIVDGLTKVWQANGVRGLYAGLWPSIVGIFPYIGCEFMMYEVSKVAIIKHAQAQKFEKRIFQENARANAILPTSNNGVTVSSASALSPLASFFLAPMSRLNEKDEIELSRLGSLCCGAAAGAVAQTVAFPLDLVRRRMQVQGFSNLNYAYKGGILRTMKTIVQNEGLAGLYHGLAPNLVKAVPSVAITFVIYEQMRKALNMPAGVQ